MASSIILHTTSFERNTIESVQILVKSKVMSDDAIVAIASTPTTAQSISSSSIGSLTRSSFGSETSIRLSVFPSFLSNSKRSSIETIGISKLQLTTQVISASKSSAIGSLTASPSSEFSTGSRGVASTAVSVPLTTTNIIKKQSLSDLFSSKPKTITVESSLGLAPTQKKTVSESLITIVSQSSAQSTYHVLVSKPITYSSVQARKSTAESTARPVSNTTQTSLLQNIPTSIETKLPSSTHDRSTPSLVAEGSTSANYETVLSSTALHDKSSMPRSVEISTKPSTSNASTGSIYSPVINANTRGLNITAKGLSSLNTKPSTGPSTDGYSLPLTDVVIVSVRKGVGSTTASSRSLESSTSLGASKSIVSVASLWSITSASSSAANLSSPTTLITPSLHASNVIQPGSLTSLSRATVHFSLSSTALWSPRYDVSTGSAHSYSQTLGLSSTIISPSSSLAIASARSNTVSTEAVRIQPSFSTKLVSSSTFTPTSSLGSQSTVLNIVAQSSQGNSSSTLVEPLLTYSLNQTQLAMLSSLFESTATITPEALSSVASSSKSILARSQTQNIDMVATASHSPGSRSDALASSLIETTFTVKQLSQLTTVSPVHVKQRTSTVHSDLKTSSRVADVSRYSDARTSYKDGVIFSSSTSASGLQHSETMILDSSPKTGISGVSSDVDSKKSFISNTVSPIPSYMLSGVTLPEDPTTFVSATPTISRRLSFNTSFAAPSDIVALSQPIHDFNSSVLASSLSVAQIISSNIHRASETSVIMTYLPPILNVTSTEQPTTLTGISPTFTAALTKTTFSLSNQQRLTSITSTESSQDMPLSLATSLHDSVSPSIGISNFQHSTSSVSVSLLTAAFVSLLSGFKVSTSMTYSLKARDISDVMTMTTKRVASATVQSTKAPTKATIQSSLLLPAADISVNNETRSISVSQFTTGKSFEFKPASTLDSMSSRGIVRLTGFSASEPTVSSRDISVPFVNFSPNTISLQIEPTVSSMTSSHFATVNSPNAQTISTMSLATVNASKSNTSRISQTLVTSLLASFDSSVPRSFAAPAPINRSSRVDIRNTSAAAESRPSSSSGVSDIGLPMSPKFSVPRQESASSIVIPTLKLSSIQIYSFMSIKEFSSNATAPQTAVSTSQLTDILSTKVDRPLVTPTQDHSSLEGISATSALAISPSSSLITGQPILGRDSVILSTGLSPPSTSLLLLTVSNRTEIGANNTVLTTMAASTSVATVAFSQGSDPLKSTIKAAEVVESSYPSLATTTRLSVDVNLSPTSSGTRISNTVAVQGSMAKSGTFVLQSSPASTAYPVSSAYESISRGHPTSTPAFTSLLVRPYKSTSSFSITARFTHTKLPVSNQSPIDYSRESSIYIATIPSTVSSQFQSISKFAGRTVYSRSSSATSTYTVESKSTVSIPAMSSTVYPFQVQESSSLTLSTAKRARSSSSIFGKPRLTTHDAVVSASSIFKRILPSVTSIESIATSPGVGLKSSSVAPASYRTNTKEVKSSAVGETLTFTSATPKSFRSSKVPSSAIITPQRSSFTAQPSSSKLLITPTPPSVYGLAYVPLQVPVTKDVLSQAYKASLESKIITTYNLLKYKRRRRAVTLAGNTATVRFFILDCI